MFPLVVKGMDFVRRHRWAVAGGSLAGIGVVVAIVVTIVAVAAAVIAGVRLFRD